ncbi:hypothetical protein BTO20_05870 [Mycobacterium dioxanotrophicus]|uniref:Uncharacterized protein n=1 Tax=Mycobacterium dioxanotrophicus TaxID=482462 RepID=A0A1Y0BZ75_9MYCO|nr:hypothetical protein [Mycobacterium dioxanotrophicus]ART68176.1 hypothetical protein BTO20_05870 [Mycobacterium dioxanotrophicus]
MTIDELAAVLRVHQGPFFHGTHSRCGCRRIVLTADEWARHVAEEQRAAVVKARTITTVEQLDALPMRSIVRCARGFAWAKHSPNPRLPSAVWYDAGCEDGQYPGEVPLPATVLYNPEADQ